MLDLDESMFDNRRNGDRVYGNQTDIIHAASTIRGRRGIRIPGFPGCRSGRGRDVAGAARAARATAAGRAGPRHGGDGGGVRFADPGPRGRRLGGRGLVRDRRGARGECAGRGGAGPGRGTDPAGPRSGTRLAAGGRVAARRVRARLAAAARAGAAPGSPGPAAAGGDAAAGAGRAAGGRRLAGGASPPPVLTQGWTGLGDGHGRLRACCAQVTAGGRGEAAATRTRWLWLPAEDGGVSTAEPPGIPVPERRLQAVRAG